MEPKVQKILAQLSKEKQTERIELGLVEDYNKRIDKANNERKSAAVHFSTLLAKMSNVVMQLELALKDAERIEEASKDLGVKPPVDVSKVKARLSKFRKSLNALDGLRIRGGDAF